MGWFYFFILSMIVLLSLTVVAAAHVVLSGEEIYRFNLVINYLDVHLYYHAIRTYV